MFNIIARNAKSEIRTQDEIDAILKLLGEKGYRPLLRSLRESAKVSAGLESRPIPLTAFLSEDSVYRRSIANRDLPVGDLMFKGEQVYLVQPFPKKLTVWEVRQHTAACEVDQACSDVEECVREAIDGRRVRGMDFSWEDQSLAVRRLARRRTSRETALDSKSPALTEVDASQAQVLIDPERRSALRKLAQVGKVRTVDSSLKSDDNIAGPLLKTGLVSEEYLLTCRQDSHTICTVDSKNKLEANSDLKCSICGRSFGDEKVHEILALTEPGRAMLAGSHWMTIWLTDLLIRSGVPIDSISWNAEAGEDELDIIVDLMGIKVFFELKDRDFGLGDAYPFSARVSRYGGDYGVVVSTERIADEAKGFLNERRAGVGSLPFIMIEGIESIENDVPDLITSLSISAVQRHLSNMDSPVGASLMPVLDAWMRERAHQQKAVQVAV